MTRSLLLAVMVAGLYGRVFGQTELITNGGFEFGLNGWLPGTANASASTNEVHSGAYSLALTSVAGSEEVFQNFTVPPTTVQATLSYYYSIFSVDGSGKPNAAFSVWLADSTHHRLALVDSQSSTNWDRIEDTFHQKSLDVTPYLRTNGGNLQLQFDVVGNTNAAGGTIFYIDDVSVLAVDAADRGPNDYFTNADLLLGTSATMTVTNAYATKERGEPNHAGNPGGHSLWWRWRAPGAGTVTITTDGSDFDTLLAAYTGTVVSNLTRVAANDDSTSGRNLTSRISFAVTPGTEYRIAVDGKDGATGMVVLALSFALDTTGPTVAFTAPGAGATVTNTQVTVQGTAKDSVGVAWVEYRLENANGTNDYQRAQGTNRWTATVTNLIPGVNTVRVRAYDTSTNVSAAAVARAFYYDIFAPAKGTYAGLLATNSPGATNLGFFTATVASKGKLSARLLLGGRSYALAGQFGFDTNFSKSILRPGTTPLSVQLTVGLAGEDAMVGTVSDGTWTVPLRANRAVYSRTSPAPQGSKKYTLVMQNGDESANQPAGYGFGAVSIDGTGNVSFTGTLGDGARVSQRTFLSKAGEWPLYFSLAAGKEVLAGWLVFTNTVESDFNGTVNWCKQPQPGKLYPGGFLFPNGVAAVGSRYAYTNGVPVLDLPNGRVWLQAGNLSTDLTNFFSLDNHNKLLSTNKLHLTLSTAAGTFRGTVPAPDTGKPIAVSGALLQKQNGGFGCFLGTNQTGRVTLGQ